MTVLSDIRPRAKELVFDLVDAAGFDTADWIASSNDPRGPKANPKYCYEWAFLQPGKLVILNLWHRNMVEENGHIIQRENFRSDAEFHKRVSRKSSWANRAARLDNFIQIALRDNLPVRVIINDGTMRDKRVVDSKPSHVTARELDPQPWAITGYDWATGAHELTRGILNGQFVDQFDLDQVGRSEPVKRDQAGSVFVRDPGVRRRVLNRAGGACEHCGVPGFRMASGALYLETHHIVPLCEGGADTVANVVALCANDHRRAHHAYDRLSMRAELLALPQLAAGSAAP